MTLDDAELEGAPKGFYLLGHRDARHGAAELAQQADAELTRLRAECERLRGLLTKVLDTNKKEAKALLAWQTAVANYSDGGMRECDEHTRAMCDSMNAEKEARAALTGAAT